MARRNPVFTAARQPRERGSVTHFRRLAASTPLGGLVQRTLDARWGWCPSEGTTEEPDASIAHVRICRGARASHGQIYPN